MADSFAVREAIKVAALAWIKWDQEMAQPCVCGHTAANHLEGGCRVIEAQAMCNCSCYEAAAQPPRVHDYTDPYGPDGMGGLAD